MMVIGKMTKLMGMDNILIQMEHNMKDIGLTISNTAKVKSIGQMEHNTKEHTNTVKKTGMASSYGQINPLIVVHSLTTIFMVTENIDGLTIESILEIGLIIKCTELEYLLGLMEENMKENILTIRNKATEYSPGQMDVNMMVSG